MCHLIWFALSLCIPQCHRARVALVITVGSGTHVQAVQQLNEHQVIHAGKKNHGSQAVFRAHDARASCAVSHVLHVLSLKIKVSCLDAYPCIQIALRILFHTPTTRSLERDKWFRPPTLRTVWSSLDQKDTTPKWKTQCYVAQKERMVRNLVAFSLAPSQLIHKTHGHGGEKLFTLRSTRSSDAT